MKSITTWFAAAALCLAACDSSIAPDKEAGDDGEGVGDPSETVIDASADDVWVYFDLETGEVVEPESPEQSSAWDIAFRRFHVAMNSGISGSGSVEAVVLRDVPFDDVTSAPDAGYAIDEADSDDDGKDPDYFMSSGETGWWAYNPMNHVLTPRAHVYVVRTAQGGLSKLAFLDYYNDAGSSGYPKIRFAQLVAPAPSGDGDSDGDGDHDAAAPDAGEPLPDAGPVDYDTLTVDASASGAWTYLKIGAGTVSIADPATSLGWDLAFKRFMIQTNSGTSGSGQAGARLLEADFASTVELPTTEGFEADEVIAETDGTAEFSGSPALNGWYDYDVTTHRVTPKDVAFLVRDAGGAGYAKLRITDWANGVFTIDLGVLE
jgi:hypothetical protein